MAIIYQPQIVFNAREAVQGSLVQTVLRAASDFVAGENQPWSYYLGVGLGTAAMATGIPGAAVTLYVIGDSLDFWLFKSPDASELRFFLNGVQLTSLDTYAATSVWELVQDIILAPGTLNEFTIVNHAASITSGATGVAWLALGDLTVFGDNALAYGAGSPNMDTIVYRLKDSESSPKRSAFAVSIPSGQTLATIQAYSDIAAKRLDLVTGSEIDTAEVLLNLTLPDKTSSPASDEIKDAPIAGILNERGGLISFNTTGPRNESIWVPGMRTTIMPGDDFSLADTAVASLTAMFTGNVTANSVAIRPVSPNDYQFSDPLYGKKSLRRKG